MTRKHATTSEPNVLSSALHEACDLTVGVEFATTKVALSEMSMSPQSHFAINRVSKESISKFQPDASGFEYVARARESQDSRPLVSIQSLVEVHGFSDSDCVCVTLPLFPTRSTISYQEVQGRMLLRRLF